MPKQQNINKEVIFMAEKYMKTIQFETGGDVYHPLPVVSKGGVVPIAGTAGKLWTIVGETSSLYLNCLAACANSVVFGDSDGKVYKSTDGKTLGSPIAVASSAINGLCYHNGVLICTTDGSGMYRSTDEGATWEYIDQDIVTYGSGPWILNNKWFAYEQRTAYSDDGLTWAELGERDLEPRGYIDGLYIGIASGLGIKYSTDLTTWTQSNITSGTFLSVCNADGLLVTGGNSTGLYYSTDGKTWTQSSNTRDSFYSIYNANGLWVAGSSGRGLWYSADGKTWTVSNVTSGTFESLYYANGLWVAGSNNNGAYYSTDGKMWTQSNITSKSFKNITSYKNILIALNSDVLCYSEPETNQLESPDNGSILQVVNGEWAMVAVTNAEEVEY